jgi:hypothetical protein
MHLSSQVAGPAFFGDDEEFVDKKLTLTEMSKKEGEKSMSN